MNRFLDPYYLGNFALLAGYPLIRAHALTHGALNDFKWSRVVESKQELIHWEEHTAKILAAALVIKFFRRQSLDGFWANAFLFTKTAVALMVWVCDIRMFCYYMMLYWMHFLLTRQPLYEGPNQIHYLDAQQFHEQVVGSKHLKVRRREEEDGAIFSIPNP